MHRSLALAAVLMVVGCSGEEGDSKGTPGAAEGPCAERLGSYLEHHEEQANGTCGPINDNVFAITKMPAKDECTGPVDVSADICTVTIDVSCPQPNIGKGFTTKTVGTVRWSEDGSAGEGTLSISLLKPDSTADCRSVYKVTYTRQ
jgi:hypothetical protein